MTKEEAEDQEAETEKLNEEEANASVGTTKDAEATEKPKETEKEVAEKTVETKEEMTDPVEAEAKPAKEEKTEEEEEIVEERFYTVPLGKALIMPASKRAPRAVRMLRSFITKHMKVGARKETEGEEEEEEPAKLTISNDVNQRIWGRGIGKPPRKIRVRAAKDKDGNVTVYLAEAD